jgi:hypothetical protein
MLAYLRKVRNSILGVVRLSQLHEFSHSFFPLFSPPVEGTSGIPPSEAEGTTLSSIYSPSPVFLTIR